MHRAGNSARIDLSGQLIGEIQKNSKPRIGSHVPAVWYASELSKKNCLQ